MSDRLIAEAPGALLDALGAHFATWSRSTLKQRLRLGCVQVNGTVVTRHDHRLVAGDTVQIVAKAAGQVALDRTAAPPVLYADDDLIAIDKPTGMLSVAADDQKRNHALAIVRESLSRPGFAAQLWPVHRLDRETSGVLLFARSRAACDAVQADWSAVDKTYLAIVAGHPSPAEQVIDAPLWEDNALRVRVGDHPAAKPARTRFRTERTTRSRALLEVQLDSGRKHQIRVHLAHRGHPIVGDERYGERDERLGLHAVRLALRQPFSGAPIEIVAPPPAAFLRLLAGSQLARRGWHFQASHLTISAASSRTPEELTRDFKSVDRIVLGTPAHSDAADRVWLGRHQGSPPVRRLDPDADVKLEVLHDDWSGLLERRRTWGKSHQDAVLLDQLRDRVGLMPVDATAEGREEESERGEVGQRVR